METQAEENSMSENAKTPASGRPRYIWELTEVELEVQLAPGIHAVRQDLFAKGLPVSYIDESCCESESHFVNEYADGRKYLIEFNSLSRRETVLRQVNG